MSYVDVSGLGNATQRPAPATPDTIRAVGELLARVHQEAARLAAAVVEATPWLSRSASREWQQRFTTTVAQMVARVMTPAADGVYSWQVSPHLLTAIADFVDSEARAQGLLVDEFLSVSSNLRQFAEVVGTHAQKAAAVVGKEAGAVIAEAAKSTLESIPSGKTGVVVYAVGGLAALVAVAYVWRAFR